MHKNWFTTGQKRHTPKWNEDRLRKANREGHQWIGNTRCRDREAVLVRAASSVPMHQAPSEVIAASFPFSADIYQHVFKYIYRK